MKAGIRVFLVEDDFYVREMVQAMVESIGHVVTGTAENGLDALEKIPLINPEIVIMDIRMPDMDGIEATRKLFERHPVPVIMLSAFETFDLVEKASEAGAGAYLIKPPNRHELARSIYIARARFNDLQRMKELNIKLQEALEKVKLLSGLLPICAVCKRIRDDRGYWHQVEQFISEHSAAEFSHGLCPECLTKMYPDFSDNVE